MHRAHTNRLPAALLVVVAGLWAYSNSFSGPFIFDDVPAILENPSIRILWPISMPPLSSVAGRPVASLSLAINYALGGFEVFGYHLLNLLIHLAAGLVLFGIVRRLLVSERLRARYGQAAWPLALSVALIWVVHPLNTDAVTYVIQRTEVLMGFFYLLTLYAMIRGRDSPHSGRWHLAAVLSCALGMGSKEVMVTAPLVTLLCDRVFFSRSLKDVFRRRWGLYAGLALTWLILAGLVATHPRALSAGVGHSEWTPSAYATTQLGVILQYLRLALWPHPLVLLYDWPAARTLAAVGPPAVGIAALLIGTVWSLRRRPALGFLGAWFFLILAPTSSILPVFTEIVAERRMYLPLAAVVVLVVVGASRALDQLRGAVSDRVRRLVAAGLVVVVTGTLVTVTRVRNLAYASRVSIWAETVAQQPHNYKARNNLGFALFQEGRIEEAMAHYTEALRLKPDFADTHNNVGVVLFEQGRFEEAIARHTAALRLKPDFALAHNNVGAALVRQGRLEEAVPHYTEALRLDPELATTHTNLGVVLAKQGQLEVAMQHFMEALRFDPDDAQAHGHLERVRALHRTPQGATSPSAADAD